MVSLKNCIFSSADIFNLIIKNRGVPANLQGIWNQILSPPWRSNYTTNTILKRNSRDGQSSEMTEPLVNVILKGFAINGAQLPKLL